MPYLHDTLHIYIRTYSCGTPYKMYIQYVYVMYTHCTYFRIYVCMLYLVYVVYLLSKLRTYVCTGEHTYVHMYVRMYMCTYCWFYKKEVPYRSYVCILPCTYMFVVKCSMCRYILCYCRCAPTYVRTYNVCTYISIHVIMYVCTYIPPTKHKMHIIDVAVVTYLNE